jgi:hypothetical protein
MTRQQKWILVAAFLVVAGATTAWLVAEPPPLAAFDAAREAVSDARAAEAERYAPEAYRAGEESWARALEMWKAENVRFFFLRNYAPVDSAARTTAYLAESARRKAEDARDSLRFIARLGRDAVRERLHRLQDQVDRMPLQASWRDAATRSRSLLAESEGAYERSDFLTAAQKADQAKALLEHIDDGVQGSLITFLAGLPAWQRWNLETIQRSAKTRTKAIVVDKMALRLHLYDSGRLLQSYPIELGPRWMGPKQAEGDHATPEGRYLVRRKRGRGETIYYRALEINYPNKEDRARFERARRDGTLPREARIGGQIEIHGEGGVGANWTRGCIALHNDDMKALFDKVEVSTPVTIVGALDVPDFLGGMPARNTKLWNSSPTSVNEEDRDE